MKTILLLAVLGVAGYFVSQQLGFGGSAGAVEVADRGGRKVLTATIADAKVNFSVREAVAETYMIFGGDAVGDSSSHGSVSGIPLMTAQRIMKRYPDFHLCSSPGAEEGQEASEDIKLIVGKGAVHSKLKALVAEQEARRASHGERLCSTLTGNWLALDNVDLGGGKTLTAEEITAMAPAGAVKQRFLFAQGIETRECKDLM